MRKHQRRNTYDMERASAAVVRRHQAPKRERRKKALPSPEQVALLDCGKQIMKMRLRGEIVPSELHERYRILLKEHHASLSKNKGTQKP